MNKTKIKSCCGFEHRQVFEKYTNLTNFLTTKKPENYKPIVSSFAILCLLNSSDE